MSGPALTQRQLNRATLTRQLLAGRSPLGVVDAVRQLAGLQAQEARPPAVGLWSRLAGFRRADLRDALHARQLVRATGVRGTLHLSTAADYIDARAPLLPMLTDGLRALGERGAGLDLAGTIAAARRHLAAGPLTFAQLRPRLVADFPGVNDRALGYAARLLVPLVLVPTADEWSFPATAAFALADEWLGREIRSDAGTGDLIRRYLAAFGPASVADFQAWSGLSRMKAAFEALRTELVTFAGPRGRELFDLADAPRPGEEEPIPVRLLPEFDNVLLAHDDRSRIVADEHRGQVVTRNLRVNAVFLVDGVAAGVWSVERKRTTATLTLRPFAPLPARVRTAVVAEAEAALAFIGPDATPAVVSEPG